MVDDAEKAAKEAADAAEELVKARKDAFDKLRRLMDSEAAIRKRMEDLQQQHHRRLVDLSRQYNDDQQRVLDERREQLVGWADIAQRVQVGWGNSVSALARNVADQIAVFDEWSDALGDARARGVSEAVIDMLGLAEGPQALGQLRMFSTATQAEVDSLNSAVLNRTAQAGDQVGREQTQTYSEIGGQLTALAERHAAEIEAATKEFLAGQRDLRDELTALGMEQGQSYAAAIAEGLRSELESVRQAARELQDAARAEERAAARTPTPGAAAGGSGGGYIPIGSPIPAGSGRCGRQPRDPRRVVRDRHALRARDRAGVAASRRAGRSVVGQRLQRHRPPRACRRGSLGGQIDIRVTDERIIVEDSGLTENDVRVIVHRENRAHAGQRTVVGSR